MAVSGNDSEAGRGRRAGSGLRAAQSGNRLVLGGDARQCEGLELAQLLDLLALAGGAFPQGGCLGFEPSDLGILRVREGAAGVVQWVQPT
ncbi:hypothetical protein ACFVXC_41090 [Streptomyces sp. NPDC058257]|uniref:hypothetical protein n=1 Tax=Streptomyces sp. NPDC058257 TaxID=3346409 RepID=UPI0036EFC21D